MSGVSGRLGAMGVRFLRLTADRKVVCPNAVARLGAEMNRLVPKHLGEHANVTGANLYWHVKLLDNTAEHVSRVMERDYDCVVEPVRPDTLLLTPPVDSDPEELGWAIEALGEVIRPPGRPPASEAEKVPDCEDRVDFQYMPLLASTVRLD